MWKGNIAACKARLNGHRMIYLVVLGQFLVRIAVAMMRTSWRRALTFAESWHNSVYTEIEPAIPDAISQANRLEARSPARPGHREPAGAGRTRPGVRRQRVLRPEGSDPGEVRDAPARPIGRPRGGGRGGELRRITPDLLQGAGRLRARRPGGLDARQARAPRSAQADGQGHGRHRGHAR